MLLDVVLHDGRTARLRTVRVDDAERMVALDRVLAEDGRGMVLGRDEVRTPEREREGIERLVEAMETGASCGLVAEVDGLGGLAGSARLDQLGPARLRHVGVLSLGVHPAMQRHGIGRALMDALIDHARASGILRLELYVRADNPRARSLYRSLGFEDEGVRERFVRLDDGGFVDDVIMRRFLSTESP